jgi:hypothetical protein
MDRIFKENADRQLFDLESNVLQVDVFHVSCYFTAALLTITFTC